MEYGDSIRSFCFVDGRGGDGGVEAFAVLDSGSVVGLQAKAFWDGFKAPQKTQISKSIKSAKQRHPTLIRYVVCCPLDLLGSRGSKTEGKSQLDRWQAFESEVKTSHPDVKLEYCGETEIHDWLQQPNSETIRAYWFDKSAIPRTHWREQFERVKSAWLNLRYKPDLHVATVLDDDFAWYINSPQYLEDLRARITRMIGSLEEKRSRITNLPNLPVQHSIRALVLSDHISGVIGSALSDLSLLFKTTETLGVPTIENSFSLDWDTRDAIAVLLGELGGKGRIFEGSSPTSSVIEAAKMLWETLESVGEVIETQKGLLRLLFVLGEAGTGKTQTITKLCDFSTEVGVPVLVIPARAYDPKNGWNSILSQACNRPGWTADEILDALEASSLLAWRESSGPRLAPHRPILAIDGPDESTFPESWKERLIELADLCRSRSLIATIVTTRPESVSWLPSDSERFEQITLYAQDLVEQLPEIFDAYAKKYDITVPSPDVVAWALRTPLAIRTFADVYEGQTVVRGEDLVTSLSPLLEMKVQRLDDELHRSNQIWCNDKQLSLRILGSLVSRFIEEGECAYHDFAQSVEDQLRQFGVKVDNAPRHFEKSAREHGLIEVRKIPGEPMEPDQLLIRPGFSALLDYLVATKISKSIKLLAGGGLDNASPEQIFPETLHGRASACSLIVSMLLKDGLSILDLGIWQDSVQAGELEAWHARAISDMSPDQASNYKEWVSSVLRRDMESCRMIVAELIFPSSRIPSATFGADFLHLEFTQMTMAERDLIWSGPDYLPKNCGGSWEGHGISVHDSIKLRDDDSENHAPLLVAWTTSSVIQKRQRKAISQLAEWGSKCPAELALLVRRFANVDDLQVKESIAVAMVGAVLELVEEGAADELAQAVHEEYFEGRDTKGHPGVVARFAARLVIERAFKIGSQLPDSVLVDARPPYSPMGQLLSIDEEEASSSVSDGRGDSPLFGDLDWYVSKKAMDLFFCAESPTKNESENRPLRSVPQQLLDAVIADLLTLEAGVRSAVAEEIEHRNQSQSIWKLFRLPTAEDKTPEQEENGNDSPSDEDSGKIPEKFSPEELKKIARIIEASSPKTKYSPEAEARLKEYADSIDECETLAPKQLVDGLITQLVKEWGWNSNVFVGAPNGDKRGEQLGADIAIMRRHSRATHGSRSSVAMFGEKYVWSAVNVISSFLCDRLPGIAEYGSTFGLITNQSDLGSRMPDPLIGARTDTRPELRSPWAPQGIAPTPTLTESRQPERGIEWLNLADWPDPEDWLNAEDDDSVLLSGFWAEKDHQQGVQIAAWMSYVAIPREHKHLIERDIHLAPDLWASHEVHDIQGYFDGGIYNPPRLAVWAPWMEDAGINSWVTVNDSGEPVEIPMIPLVTKVHWDGEQGETSGLIPTKRLRDAGKIIIQFPGVIVKITLTPCSGAG